MSNTRGWLIGLVFLLVLVTGGVVTLSIPGKWLSVDAVPGPTGPASVPDGGMDASGGGPNVPTTSTVPGDQVASDNTARPTLQASQVDAQLYCPKQSELFKKDMFWYGPNAWRDYSASFVKNINNFAGAQWVGVNVGKIICLYKGVEENNFPVAIERDNLMKKPSGSHWKSDPSGYQLCQSDNVMDCPFTPQDTKSDENVYDFLKDIKKK